MPSLKACLPATISTPRLTLELFDYSDAHYQCLLACINNPTAYKTLGDINVKTPADFDAMNKSARLTPSVIGGLTIDTDLYYVARLKDSAKQLVGGVSLMQHSGKTPPDEGWAVREEFTGKGYASEMAKALLTMVRDYLGIKDVMAWPGVSNLASLRIAEKAGFVRGGTLPDRDGNMHAVYILPHMEFDERIALSLWGS